MKKVDECCSMQQWTQRADSHAVMSHQLSMHQRFPDGLCVKEQLNIKTLKVSNQRQTYLN